MSSAAEIIQRADLGPLEFIAEGGQGRVYRCPRVRLADFAGPLAYKEFKAGQLKSAGLESIIAMRSRLSDPQRRQLDALTTWPVRLVRDGAAVVGLLMPLIPEEFVHVGRSLTGVPLRKEREIQFLFLAAQRCDKLGYPRVNLFQRYAICEGIATAFALLHEHDVVYGDFSAKNALFAVGPGRTDAKVIVVDCDAVRMRGTMSAVAQLNSPDWEPPPGEHDTMSQATDLFKFGLFVLRVLSPGSNASTARDVRRVDQVLDDPGRRLLRSSLSAVPEDRPTARTWAQLLCGCSRRGHSPRCTLGGSRPPTVVVGSRVDPRTGRELGQGRPLSSAGPDPRGHRRIYRRNRPALGTWS